MSTVRRVALGLSLLLVTAGLEARVVSYAPVTDRTSIPAVQHRTNRRYLLIERELPPSPSGTSCAPGYCFYDAPRGRLVLHDSKGDADPSAIFPLGSGPVGLAAAAAREEPDGTLRVLVLTDAQFGTDNPSFLWRWAYSPDGGATWRVLPVPGRRSPGWSMGPSSFTARDLGGPIVRGRRAQVQIGSADRPFVFSEPAGTTGAGATVVPTIYGVTADGQASVLMTSTATSSLQLMGSDREGASHLVSVRAGSGTEVYRIGRSGAPERLCVLSSTSPPSVDGFLTPTGEAYLTLSNGTWESAVQLYRQGTLSLLAQAPSSKGAVFAVPTSDFSGAWIVKRETGTPTILYSHSPSVSANLVEAWHDVSGPEVEALHAGSSGKRLLVQVHRSRPLADQRIFKDPALAVWEVGQAAPKGYDELYLNEYLSKGFVHLDVESVASGDPFVFDSGEEAVYYGGPSSGGGGADVLQEWGVVRASLRQRLVVPAVARAAGARGSFWRTDLVLRNPLTTAQSVTLRFVPAGADAVPIVRTIRLAPNEVRVTPDLLLGLFGVDSGSGALFLTPEGEGAIEATTRTYTTSPEGSFGMGVGAVDVFASASPRFPLTFAAAIQGGDFRSNIVVADTSGRGVTARLHLLAEGAGLTGAEAMMAAPAGGQVQVNGLASLFGTPSWQSGAAIFQPVSGEALAGVIGIDNATNDPTYFPADLPAPVVRTIPAIVHRDGANGARFRSDLFLVNLSNAPRSVLLLAKGWDRNEGEKTLSLTLLPRESKTIHDVLATAFGKEGVARLRYQSSALGAYTATEGVRVTSRTYTITPAGATYGLLVPPLNAFQSAGVGDTLEILGPVGGRDFRTNLSLVELSAFSGATPVKAKVEVLDEKGVVLDFFEMSIPLAGGLQIDDLFRSRGLGDGPAAALVRITPFSGNLAAYATLIDNGTNDPTYFAASLGAKY